MPEVIKGKAKKQKKMKSLGRGLSSLLSVNSESFQTKASTNSERQRPPVPHTAKGGGKKSQLPSSEVKPQLAKENLARQNNLKKSNKKETSEESKKRALAKNVKSAANPLKKQNQGDQNQGDKDRAVGSSPSNPSENPQLKSQNRASNQGSSKKNQAQTSQAQSFTANKQSSTKSQTIQKQTVILKQNSDSEKGASQVNESQSRSKTSPQPSSDIAAKPSSTVISSATKGEAKERVSVEVGGHQGHPPGPGRSHGELKSAPESHSSPESEPKNSHLDSQKLRKSSLSSHKSERVNIHSSGSPSDPNLSHAEGNPMAQGSNNEEAVVTETGVKSQATQGTTAKGQSISSPIDSHLNSQNSQNYQFGETNQAHPAHPSVPSKKIMPEQNAVGSPVSPGKPFRSSPDELPYGDPSVGEKSSQINRIWNVSVGKVFANRRQPRKDFDASSIEELARSISQQGILQPITVRTKSEGYEIIAGERRWRAAQKAGLHQVPVIIKEVDDQKVMELALIENIQRENLNPVEEAIAYQQLAEDYGLTQAEIAQKVGKDRATVANSLRMLALPKEVKKALRTKEISTGHAKVLLSLSDPLDQVNLLKKALMDKLSVRALEKEVRRHKLGEVTSTNPQAVNVQLQSITNDLQNSLGTKVKIKYRKGRGKLEIAFYSEEQFQSLLHRLGRGTDPRNQL